MILSPKILTQNLYTANNQLLSKSKDVALDKKYELAKSLYVKGTHVTSRMLVAFVHKHEGDAEMRKKKTRDLEK